MTNSNQNDPVSNTPVATAKASWGWLQGRIGMTSDSSLHEWIDEQLHVLEEKYADFVTAESLKLNLRNEIRQSRQ